MAFDEEIPSNGTRKRDENIKKICPCPSKSATASVLSLGGSMLEPEFFSLSLALPLAFYFISLPSR
jgi:hypothetical protein